MSHFVTQICFFIRRDEIFNFFILSDISRLFYLLRVYRSIFLSQMILCFVCLLSFERILILSIEIDDMNLQMNLKSIRVVRRRSQNEYVNVLINLRDKRNSQLFQWFWKNLRIAVQAFFQELSCLICGNLCVNEEERDLRFSCAKIDVCDRSDVSFVIALMINCLLFLFALVLNSLWCRALRMSNSLIISR